MCLSLDESLLKQIFPVFNSFDFQIHEVHRKFDKIEKHGESWKDLEVLSFSVSIRDITLLNKTRTSKVGAIPKAQKAQNIFSRKKNFCRKMSNNAKICRWGTLLDLLTDILLQDFKNSKGVPFGVIKKFSKKVAQCRKKPKGTL